MRLPAARVLRSGHRARFATAVSATGIVVLVALASLTVPRPFPSTSDAAENSRPPGGTRYWHLATGSRLAYLEIPAVGTPKPTPVIAVGGGPGEADVTDHAQAHFLSALTRLGYDVYLYDQIRAGLSQRLPDPAGYTVARHVADLDAIRHELGAEQMVLLGSSWGGSLVASYLARHPGRVAKAVLTSPAPINYADWDDAGSVSARLPATQRKRADALLPGTPRFALWYALGAINPRAAHNLVPDTEADAYFSTYLGIVRPGTVCDPKHLPDQHETGNGFYDNIFTTRDASEHARPAYAKPSPATTPPRSSSPAAATPDLGSAPDDRHDV